MENPENKRVLVTGSSGFIGANLVRQLLKQNSPIHALVRPGSDLWRLQEVLPHLKIHPVDLVDLPSLQRTIDQVQPQLVYHLAFPGGHAPDLAGRAAMLRSSVLGTFNLLEALRPVPLEHLVHLGSFLETGHRSQPLQEDLALEPATFRGVTKVAQTLLCQQYGRETRKAVTILRIFSVYGYWEAPGRLIPKAILAAILGKDIDLTTPGYRRDLVFVEDVIAACQKAARVDLSPGEVLNIGSGQQWSNEEVIETIQALTGKKIVVRPGVYPARQSDAPFCVANIQKAQRLFNWRPLHSLQEALNKTIAWFQQHLDLYR